MGVCLQSLDPSILCLSYWLLDLALSIPISPIYPGMWFYRIFIVCGKVSKSSKIKHPGRPRPATYFSGFIFTSNHTFDLTHKRDKPTPPKARNIIPSGPGNKGTTLLYDSWYSNAHTSICPHTWLASDRKQNVWDLEGQNQGSPLSQQIWKPVWWWYEYVCPQEC